LTKECPKPLLEVSGRPIIDYIIDKLNSLRQIDGIIVITNSKFIAKFRKWKKTVQAKKQLILIDDQSKSNADRRGAIGDINFAINKLRLKDDLLVIGGDNLFSGTLKNFIAFAVKNKPASTVGFYKLRNLKDASKYGVARLDKSGKVIDFAEKPLKPKSRLVAMCLYYIPAESLGMINDFIKTGMKVDATGNYIDWLKNRIDTYGFIFKGSWYDIGDIKYLKAANEKFAKH